MKFPEKLVNNIAEFKIRLDRGNGIIYWFRNVVIIVAAVALIFDKMTPIQAVILGIFLIAFMYFLGWFDLKHFKLFQAEHKLATGKYNPYFVSLKNDINRKN